MPIDRGLLVVYKTPDSQNEFRRIQQRDRDNDEGKARYAGSEAGEILLDALTMP
jgi:hypothetical protein